MDVRWWLLIVLAQVTHGLRDFGVTQGSHAIQVTINTLRPITQTSDKFLGISVSLSQLVQDGEHSINTVNLLQALSPGYLRVEEPNLASISPTNSSVFLLTESQWENIIQIATDTGLHPIFRLRPTAQNQSKLLKYIDTRGYNVTWQFGFSNNDGNNEMSSRDLAEEILNLRRFIDSFPRFRNTDFLSPDLEFCEDTKCMEAHKNFMLQSKDAIDSVVLQIKPQEDIKSVERMFGKLDKLSTEIEKTTFNRDNVFTKTKNSWKKYFWVAEDDTTEYIVGLKESMPSAVALGLSSRMGYHTFLLHLHYVSKPSPNYWTALLWQALVGRAVLGVRTWPQEGQVVVFASCAKSNLHPSIDMEWEYDAGAVTLWGVNEAKESTLVSLRTSSRLEHVHLYFLTGDGHGSNILLNGRPLRMIHGVLPRLSPRVRTISRSLGVIVPPQSIFFIVMPDAQAPACYTNAGEKLADPLKNQNVPPVVLNIPIPPPKTKSISSNEGIKSAEADFFIEKGGVFIDTDVGVDRVVNEKERELGKVAKGRRDKEKHIESKSEQSKISINGNRGGFNKDISFSGSYTATNIQPIIVDDILLNNNESQQLLHQFSSEVIDKNITKNLNHTLETEVQRVKRSDDYGYYGQAGITDTETSPLYRRVNLLRQILNKLRQPADYELEEQNKHFHEYSDTAERVYAKNKIKSWKMEETFNDYPVEIPSSRINRVLNEQTTRAVKNKNKENINYLPGEFYEVLGDLKLDSNISLKDKEEIVDATDTLGKQPETQKCNDKDSKLTVTKKPKNDPQEDRRLVELATESSRQYYMLKSNNTEMSNENVENNQRKNLSFDSDRMFKKTSPEDMSEQSEKRELHSGNFFKDLKKTENEKESVQIQLTGGRNKREAKQLKEEELDQSMKLSPQNEEYHSKSDYSDEVQLNRFLKELTNEGEELLQTIDEEYEIVTKQFSTTESDLALNKDETLLDHNQFLGKNKIEDTDFYLKNNILIDSEIKPKIKYPYIDEQTNNYTKLNKSTNTLAKNKDQEKKDIFSLIPDFESVTSKTDYLTIKYEPPIQMQLSTKNYENTKMSGKNIINSDFITESTTPQTIETIKPNINLMTTDKLESSGDYHHTSNNTGKTLENGDGMAKLSTQFERTGLTDNSANKYSIKPHSNIVNPIMVTEKVYDIKQAMNVVDTPDNSFKLFDNKTNNTDRDLSHTESSNYKFNKLEKPTKPVIPSIPDMNPNSSMVNSTSENHSDKKIKMDSESKLENKVLPPPSKPTSILQSLLVPSILSLNRNSRLPKKIDFINEKIAEFNRKHNLSTPVFEKSFSIDKTFSDKYKERLETIKQRVQKARERLMNLTNPRTTQLVLHRIPQKLKREISINQGIFNSLLNKQENKADTQFYKNQFDSTNKNSKGFMTQPFSSENLHLIHHLKRQIYDNDRDGSLSIEENPDGESENLKNEEVSNIAMPIYIPTIKKWVVPISSDKEQIVYNNRRFPVNLYGIVSDKWVKEIVKDSEIEEKRPRRAIKYPCIKDRFNEFEAEDENKQFSHISNVDSGKLSSIKSTKVHSVKNTETIKPRMILPQTHSTKRSRRSLNKDIEMNELEMKALLTNEIVKEKPTNDVSHQENVFSSMLHQTLSKTVSNKTGIDRMLELAKQYQKTKPSSLEILSSKNKNSKMKNSSIKDVNNDDEENAATEVTDDKSLHKSTPPSVTKHQTGTSQAIIENNFIEGTIFTNSSMEIGSTGNEQDKARNQETPGDNWSDFLNKIQEFFESVVTVIKKGIE